MNNLPVLIPPLNHKNVSAKYYSKQYETKIPKDSTIILSHEVTQQQIDNKSTESKVRNDLTIPKSDILSSSTIPIANNLTTTVLNYSNRSNNENINIKEFVNLSLNNYRTNSVKDFVPYYNGISPKRISIRDIGESNIADESTENLDDNNYCINTKKNDQTTDHINKPRNLDKEMKKYNKGSTSFLRSNRNHQNTTSKYNSFNKNNPDKPDGVLNKSGSSGFLYHSNSYDDNRHSYDDNRHSYDDNRHSYDDNRHSYDDNRHSHDDNRHSTSNVHENRSYSVQDTRSFLTEMNNKLEHTQSALKFAQ